MWTYLTILFSLLVLGAVFARRVYLHVRGKSGFGKIGSRKTHEKAAVEPVEKQEIENDIKKISKADQKELEELCKRAQSALNLGKEDEAVKFFVQALAIDELHIEAQHKLAMLYMKKKMFSAAAALFKSLGDITDEAVHYSHQGLALFQQGLFEEAKNAYQKAIELDPSRPQRFVSLAQVYRSLGQLNNAVLALNKALEIEVENLDFLFLLVDIQAELGNFDEALKIVERVLEVDPENEEAKSYIEILKRERGNRKEI